MRAVFMDYMGIITAENSPMCGRWFSGVLSTVTLEVPGFRCCKEVFG